MGPIPVDKLIPRTRVAQEWTGGRAGRMLLVLLPEAWLWMFAVALVIQRDVASAGKLATFWVAAMSLLLGFVVAAGSLIVHIIEGRRAH